MTYAKMMALRAADRYQELYREDILLYADVLELVQYIRPSTDLDLAVDVLDAIVDARVDHWSRDSFNNKLAKLREGEQS